MALTKVYEGQHVKIDRNLVATYGFSGIVVAVNHPGFARTDICSLQLDDTMHNRVEPFSLSYLLEDPDWERQLTEAKRKEEEEQAKLRERKYGRRIQF